MGKQTKMNSNKILNSVKKYYDEKLIEYGTTSRGVDWNSLESQNLRFAQLLNVCDTSNFFTINDYGCGSGALVDYLTDQDYAFQYHGFDISELMVAEARELHQEGSNCTLFVNEDHLPVANYTVASGIFNVKLQTSNDDWEAYILKTIVRIAELSEKGFAFNALSKYSDSEYMRPNLYYADPLTLFDFCKRNFSKFVNLLHDYPLYEFTIVVRK